MKNLLYIPLLTLFFFLSCSQNTLGMLTGDWEGDVTLKTELARESNPDQSAAYLYLQQHITLSFSPDGTYTKSLTQSVTRVEAVDAGISSEEAKDYYSQHLTKTLVFTGTYELARNEMHFTLEEVQEGGKEKMSYYQYFQDNPEIGDEDSYVLFTLKDDALYIDGIGYHKKVPAELTGT